jgi:hypothetical protein
VTRGFRALLFAKGALLAGLGLGFVAIALGGVVQPWRLVGRALFASLFFLVGLFPLAVSRHAFLDALLGATVEVTDAVALDDRQRRAGHSFKLPTGRYAEFLWRNPWEPLVPGARYTLVLAARSRIVVARPVRTG